MRADASTHRPGRCPRHRARRGASCLRGPADGGALGGTPEVRHRDRRGRTAARRWRGAGPFSRARPGRSAERQFRLSRGVGLPGAGPGLERVNLTVAAGEIVAVRGSNGSGKSTLLQHLNGLYRADAGSVSVGGSPILHQPTGTLAGVVGYLFQDTDQQLFERTVLREVSYGPMAAGLRREDAARRASAALDGLGLGALADAHPYELGFVQRRLVALASIMATGPDVWALDEPTAGLDEATRTLFARLVTEHARAGGTVVMATHDAAFADAVSHRIVWLDAGRIRGSGQEG
ncbi:ATP-binding cassette domain-containing protein [Vibrio cholerae]|nr:ATP-binding cassette domain-containing protein [Vibrio cholerae]